MREELLSTRNAFAPTPSDTVDISPKIAFGFLYCAGAGVVKVTTAGGDTPTFTVLAGSVLGGPVPLAITRVWATGLTATGLMVIHSGNTTT
jgi:hypothetical protein